MRKVLIGLLTVVAAAIGASAAIAGVNAPGNAPGRSVSLTILHVQNGCHVWAAGGKQSADLRVPLAVGSRLSVLNHDIDGQELIQVSGPAKLSLPASLQMNGGTVIVFPKPGVYRLVTRSFELKGMPKVETMGMDNVLRLTIVVS